MSVKFSEEEGHKYTSIDPDNQIDWISVTSLVSALKPPFDSINISEKVSKNSRSKWFGIPPEKIRKIWSMESDRASELGSSYHKQRETDLSELSFIEKEGISLPVIKPIYDWSSKVKLAPDQLLTDGIYPEHFVYLSSAGVCGQADKVEVLKSRINISDFKTNKVITTKGFTNREGITDTMLSPLDNLEDCHIVHYALQMSLYMYIILRHNPLLSPGTLILDHVTFVQEDTNQYGYPIYYQDKQGNYVVKSLKQYNIAYYKQEVISMLDYLKENRELVKSRINKK